MCVPCCCNPLCFEKKSTPEYQNTNTIPGIINRNYRISVVDAIIYNIIFILLMIFTCIAKFKLFPRRL